jgi:hypothetical protein
MSDQYLNDTDDDPQGYVYNPQGCDICGSKDHHTDSHPKPEKDE